MGFNWTEVTELLDWRCHREVTQKRMRSYGSVWERNSLAVAADTKIGCVGKIEHPRPSPATQSPGKEVTAEWTAPDRPMSSTIKTQMNDDAGLRSSDKLL